MEQILTSVGSTLGMQYREMESITNVYYMQKQVFTEIEALNNPQRYLYYEDLRKSQLENNYSITLTKEMHLSNIDILDIAFFPANTENATAYVVGINSSSIIPYAYEGYEHEAWYEQAVTYDGKLFLRSLHAPPYRQDDRVKEVYSGIRLIKDMDNQSVVGVLKIDASVSNLANAIGVLNDDSQDILLITDGNDVVASSRLVSSLDWQDGKTVKANGREYIAMSVDIPFSPWTLSYLYSLSDLRFSTFLALCIAVVVLLLSYLLAFTLFRHTSDNTVKDVDNIKHALDEIEKGNLDVCSTVRSDDEIREISDAVNNMASELKEYIAREYLMVIQNQKAEYKALQSQINPHFLYNTLNGFIALNRMGETEVLEQSIINLTYMFRYICSKDDLTTVGGEFTFVKEYLDLQKMKYAQRLQYTIELDDAVATFIIPKLLLQPLVENSIIHGMKNSDEPIEIVVHAWMEEGQVRIEVSDNGRGFDATSRNVGLSNVEKRVSLFSQGATVQVDSTIGVGTTITMRFSWKEQG